MTESDISTYCLKCGEAKTQENCAKNKNRPDGYSAYCKACCKIKMAATYQKHKEKRQARAKIDYQDKAEEYKIRAAKWAAENKEKRREISRNYVKHNPETRRETNKKHRIENPGMYAAHYKMRQTRKQRAMPLWADREKIKAIYEACARITRATGIKHHVDHYFPLKSDVVCGLHNEFNLRIIPAKDNLSKANQMPE